MQRALQAAATDANMQQLVQLPWCGLLSSCNAQFAATAAQLLPMQQHQHHARLIKTSARHRLQGRANIAEEATETDDYHAGEEQETAYAHQYTKAGSRRSAWHQQERWQGQQHDQGWEGLSARQLPRQHQRPQQQQQQQWQPQRQSQQARDEPEQQQHWQKKAWDERKQHRSSRDTNRQGSSSRWDGQYKQQQQQRGPQASGSSRRTSGSTSARGGAVWQGISGSSSSSSSSSNAGAAAGRAAAAMTPALLTCAISATSSLPELQQLLNEHRDTLQQINVCAAFKALVRLAGAADNSSSTTATALAVMRHLSNRMLQQMRVARPWDLATAAWACSKLGFSEPRLLEAIAQEAARKAPILTPQDIAQLASAYARLAYKQPQLLELLAQQALRQAAEFKPWALIHTVWALHVSGTNARPLLEACGQQLPQQLAGLQPLDVATLLWLLAACDMREQQQLVAAAAEELRARVDSYPPAAAAQALVSLAGLGFRDAQLAETAAGVMIQRLNAQLEQQQQQQESEEQTHQQPDQQIQQQPQPQQQLQQQRYGPKQVAHAIFALVRLGSSSEALLDAASAAFLAQPRGYSPALLCMLCWAFVQAGAAPAAAFSEALVGQCQAQLPRFSADQVASVIRGLHPASRWPGSPQLLAAAYTQLPQQLQHMGTPVLSKLIVTLSKQQHAARKAQQQDEQQQLQVLLQQCGQEWLARPRSQCDRLQAEAVATALSAAGLQELAAALGEVLGCDQPETHALQSQAAAAKQDTTAGTSVEEGSKQQPAAAVAGSSSWLDSFVATADDDSKQA